MMTKTFFRSTKSASAPAGRANKKIGSDTADCTKATHVGELVISAINQPDAISFIQVPINDTMVAAHMMANNVWRNGLQAEGAEFSGKFSSEFSGDAEAGLDMAGV